MSSDDEDDIPEPVVAHAVNDEEASALVDAITELASDQSIEAYIDEYDSEDGEYLVSWSISGRPYKAWLTERFVAEVFGGLGRFSCN